MAVNNQQEQGVASRVAASQVLDHVLNTGKSLDDALDHVLGTSRMPENDQKLVRAICMTVFRHLPQIDETLRQVMAQKRDPKPKILHNVLRVGVAQLLYMDVPDHAAISVTVSASGSLKLNRQKSFVNACLRSVQRERGDAAPAPVPHLDRLPAWLSDNWIKHYGQQRAERIAKASLQPAPIDITLSNLHALHENGQYPDGDALVPWSIRVSNPVGQVTSWPGFSSGAWWVQDLAASLSINMLGDVHDKSVLDIGAAPGGKTMQLTTRGARVTAIDISGSRMARVAENLKRISQNKTMHPVKRVTADACTWESIEAFDAIVIDAPCSSTGTLRRHPELPWIRSENEVMNLSMIQRDLLTHASKMVKSGGHLLYVTCSLQPEEGEIQVEWFLNQNKEFKEIKDIPESLHGFLSPGLNGIGFRTFPDKLAEKGGMDGFFMVLLQRQ